MIGRIKPSRIVLMAISSLLLYPGFAWPNPREVLLYPDGAMVTEVKKVRTVNQGRDHRTAGFFLPQTALPKSLTLSLPDDSRLRIVDVSIQSHAGKQEDRVREFKKQLQAAGEERIRLRSSLQALESQIIFWQTQAKGRAKNSAEAVNLSQTISKGLKKAVQDKLALEIESERIDQHLKQLKGELQRATEKPEHSWLATVLLTGPPLSETTLSYTYQTGSCGWRPLYQLNALLRENRVVVTRGAEVWQDTGQDWTQVLLTLADGKIREQPANIAAAGWTIKTLPETRTPKGKPDSITVMQAKNQTAGDEPEPGTLSFSSTSPAVLENRTIVSQGRSRLTLGEESWPAEFFHLARPGSSAKAILIGLVSPPPRRNLPAGDALYLVEGAFFGKETFSSSGQAAELVFGADPQVRLSVSHSYHKPLRITEASGSLNLHRMQWQTSLWNQRDHAVRIRLEENRPQFPDALVRGELSHDPPPDETGPLTLTWRREIAPSGRLNLQGELIIKTPTSLEILP
ncbi:MAG: DUF4139 domain-containing protein [Smithellaceae bacterium]|nr:DUF4139 domain-containing protein [Smithellaceae bacterium]